MVRHWDTWKPYKKRNHIHLFKLNVFEESRMVVDERFPSVDLMRGLETDCPGKCVGQGMEEYSCSNDGSLIAICCRRTGVTHSLTNHLDIGFRSLEWGYLSHPSEPPQTRCMHQYCIYATAPWYGSNRIIQIHFDFDTQDPTRLRSKTCCEMNGDDSKSKVVCLRPSTERADQGFMTELVYVESQLVSQPRLMCCKLVDSTGFQYDSHEFQYLRVNALIWILSDTDDENLF